jgi:peroxiredoxin
VTDATDIEETLNRALAEAERMDAPLDTKNAHYWNVERALLPELETAYETFVARVAAGGGTDAAPQVGSEMPEFLLPDSEGRLVASHRLLERGPLVISFNRGNWCPFCRLELKALAAAHPHIARAGASIVSIVPETACYSAPMQKSYGLPFAVLTDLDLGYALENGLAVSAGAEIKELYLGYGIDLARFQGNEAWFIPAPATFVVGSGGQILARFVDPDFRRRMPISAILEALRRG